MPHCGLIVIFRHFQVKKFGASFSCRRNSLLWSLRKHVKIHVTFTEGKNVPEKFWLFQHQLKNNVSFEKYAFLVSNFLFRNQCNYKHEIDINFTCIYEIKWKNDFILMNWVLFKSILYFSLTILRQLLMQSSQSLMFTWDLVMPFKLVLLLQLTCVIDLIKEICNFNRSSKLNLKVLSSINS